MNDANGGASGDFQDPAEAKQVDTAVETTDQPVEGTSGETAASDEEAADGNVVHHSEEGVEELRAGPEGVADQVTDHEADKNSTPSPARVFGSENPAREDIVLDAPVDDGSAEAEDVVVRDPNGVEIKPGTLVDENGYVVDADDVEGENGAPKSD